jgi:lactoylglutathione lyase
MGLPAPYAAIMVLNYEDLEAGGRFYRDILGLPLVEDQGWAKVYRICPGAFVGLVSTRGTPLSRPVGTGALLSITVESVDDVDAWHERLREIPEIEITRRPSMVADIPVYSFFFTDPGGHRVEVQTFTEPNAKI